MNARKWRNWLRSETGITPQRGVWIDEADHFISLWTGEVSTDPHGYGGDPDHPAAPVTIAHFPDVGSWAKTLQWDAKSGHEPTWSEWYEMEDECELVPSDAPEDDELAVNLPPEQ
jgi:hypothetical protein